MMLTSSKRGALAGRPGSAWKLPGRLEFPYPLAVLLVIGLAWEFAVRWGQISTIVLPRPTAVIVDLFEHWRLFASQAYRTFIEIVLGFAVSVLIGIPLAVLLGASRLMERVLYPLLVGSQTIPVVSIAPILLAWFGFGLRSKVIVVVLITFFPIMMNAFTGMKALSAEIRNLARSMGASRLQMFWHFQLPAALPAIFSGMKIATTLAVVGAVVAEFVGSDSGLGYEILLAGSNLNLAHQFAAVSVLTMLGLALFSIMSRIEKLVLPWHISVRSTNGS